MLPLSTTQSNKKPRVHFSGIGGTAMVAGARLAIEAGWEVRGSDGVLYPPVSHMVEALGVPVAEGYSAFNLDWDPDLVIIGNALSRGNDEVEAALDRGLCYVSLPEWLREAVLRKRRPVAICGTHGKTTTTAITAYLLDRCGLNPGYLIGGQPLSFEHSAKIGAEGSPFVVEGDEYDTAFFDKRAKFFHYLPEIAVVTSLEFDHGDIYPDLAAIKLAFQRMLRQIPQRGWLLLCADNPGALALQDHAYCQVATYGFAQGAYWRGEITGSVEGLHRLRIYREDVLWGEVAVPLHGRHNIQNALAAVAVAGTLGATAEQVAKALPQFKGVRRRMEIFHQARGITFVDDFAHHPTAIKETIAAARMAWPDDHLTVLFEPRSNTVVTNEFQYELTEAFAAADKVWVGPLYRADRIPEASRLNRATLVEDIGEHGIPAHFTDDIEDIIRDLHGHAVPKTIVLILSNGAFDGIYERLVDTFSA